MHNDQNIIDIIADVNRDLRHTTSFRQLLHPLDEETSRRVAKAYIEFLYRALEFEYEGVGHLNRVSGSAVD